jgi:hypothetical protein
MYREWKKIEFPKKYGWKTSWWKRVEGKGI